MWPTQETLLRLTKDLIMKKLLIALMFLVSVTSFASENYAIIKCMDSAGNKKTDFYKITDKANVVITKDGKIAFTVNVIGLEGSPHHYYERDCNSDQKEYNETSRKLLICGPGSEIDYNDGPFCDGMEVSHI